MGRSTHTEGVQTHGVCAYPGGDISHSDLLLAWSHEALGCCAELGASARSKVIRYWSCCFGLLRSVAAQCAHPGAIYSVEN